MKKALAFFGAFNPPTKAHVDLAKYAIEKTGRETVVFVPSKSSYILDDQKKQFAFSDEERVQMLQRIITNHPGRMDYTPHDINSESQPRSYDTLKWLRDEMDYDASLLIGADQFCALEEHWKYVPEIAREFGIVVLSRSFFSLDAIVSQSKFYQDILPYTQFLYPPKKYRGISSTAVRYDYQKAQEYLRELKENLPEEVFEYLKKHYL